MNIEFTNEELVFLTKHLEQYKSNVQDEIVNDMNMNIEQLEIYKKYNENKPTYNQETYDLAYTIFHDKMPKVVNTKLDMMKGVINKLTSLFDVITEAQPELLDTVMKKYIDEDDDLVESMKELNDKLYGR